MNFYDIAIKQPHLLIAGTTGSGKSTAIHGIINTVLNLPRVSLWLVDPKRVELNQYKNSPKVDAYASTAPGAALLLRSACEEMERRYRTLEKAGLQKWENGDIYIIIDELADLLIVPDKKIAAEIKTYLSRLAQLGRAARVHLIVATQFVRRSVLPLALVANIPAVVGLRTRDKLESRLLIGCAGCEALPMYGECYFAAPEFLQPQKMKICRVSKGN